jgi:hypothetical protein
VKTFFTDVEKALRSYESNSADAQQNAYGPRLPTSTSGSAASSTSASP